MRRATLFACAALLTCVDSQLTFHSGGADRVDYIYKPLRGERQPHQGGVFSGVVPGAAIVAAAGGLLWWNEGRTMRRERLLETARRQVVSHSSSREEVDPAPGGLLHLTGWLRSADGVSDSVFPQVKGELGLERMSEVFQWLEDERVEEHRTSSTHVRRETTYSYHKKWRHKTVDSGRFRHHSAHHNPTPRLAPGVGTTFATDATLDQWLLPSSLLQQLPWNSLGLVGGGGGGGGAAEGGGAALALRVENAMIVPVTDDSRGGEALYLPLLPPPPPQGLETQLELPGEVRDWMAAEGGSGPAATLQVPPAPRVGDARVRFRTLTNPVEGVSVLAAHVGGTLRPWGEGWAERGPSWAKGGLFMLRRGVRSAEDLLQEAHRDNSATKWGLRAAGSGLMWLGSYLLLSWAPALASLTPLIGGALGSLVGAGVALLSLGGALSASLLLVAAAWVRFRPLHSALLAAAAAALATAHTSLLRQHFAASSVTLPPNILARSV